MGKQSIYLCPKMKQVFIKAGKVVVEDVPPPFVGDNEVLVANSYSVVSIGTELASIRKSGESLVKKILGRPDLLKKGFELLKKRGVSSVIGKAREYRETAVPLGYSCAGAVISVGKGVSDVDIGDRVACAGGKACHSEIVTVPRNLIAKIPTDVSFEQAAFTTLGAIAMQGIRRIEVQFGETIVILGTGLLGQIAVQIAKAAGYKVIAVDVNEEKVKLAEGMGADYGLVIGKDDIVNEVLHLTEGIGADAVAIYAATSSSEPVLQAMKMARKKAKVVVVGDVGMKLEREPFYEKELDFLISRSYGPGRYDLSYEEKGLDYPIEYVRWTENRNMQAFLNLLKAGKVDVKPLISKVFSIDEAIDAYQYAMRSEERPLGVLLQYDPSKYMPEEHEIKVEYKIPVTSRKIEGKIDVAVVGAGSFAEATLLPILKEISDYNLRFVVTATGVHAKQVAERFRAEYCTTGYRDVLEDAEVDLAVIATPHNLHYPMVIEAIKTGKPVFVEKPLCLTETQLEDIEKLVYEKKVPLFVGFNRRYSPLSVKAKELMRKKHRPYMIVYRVNAGFIPKNSWIQDPEVGGGRIIGECCHFFDLFNYFIEADIDSIQVNGISVNNANVVARDNIAITIKWSEGSMSTLVYTALGHETLPKERIEIFADGGSVVLDDFKELRLYGFHEKGIKLGRQDKGHRQQLLEIARFLQGKKSNVMKFEDVVKAMKITFDVEKQLRRAS